MCFCFFFCFFGLLCLQGLQQSFFSKTVLNRRKKELPLQRISPNMSCAKNLQNSSKMKKVKLVNQDIKSPELANFLLNRDILINEWNQVQLPYASLATSTNRTY